MPQLGKFAAHFAPHQGIPYSQKRNRKLLYQKRLRRGTAEYRMGDCSAPGADSVEITDVQVNLCANNEDRLRAYCAVVFDNSFVVHNVRIIEKADGILVAMPSRKLTSKCPVCHFRNPVDGTFCGNCGTRLRDDAAVRRVQHDTKIHFDVAHPINPTCRRQIEEAVMRAYQEALQRGDAARDVDY